MDKNKYFSVLSLVISVLTALSVTWIQIRDNQSMVHDKVLQDFRSFAYDYKECHLNKYFDPNFNTKCSYSDLKKFYFSHTWENFNKGSFKDNNLSLILYEYVKAIQESFKEKIQTSISEYVNTDTEACSNEVKAGELSEEKSCDSILNLNDLSSEYSEMVDSYYKNIDFIPNIKRELNVIDIESLILSIPTTVPFFEKNFRVSLQYGKRMHPIYKRMQMHTGIDYATDKGTPVLAPNNGKVAFSARKESYGITVILEHNKNVSTLYGHLSKIRDGLTTGDIVEKGEIIGYVGSTGASTGNHLHYEIRILGLPINPGNSARIKRLQDSINQI